MKENPRVLVVDDEPVVGRSFDRVLSGKGYDVNTALNGDEALQKIGADDFDLVFTDIKMPGIDGLEMARRLKEMNPWIPVVIITGYGTDENELQAKEIGVSGFLHKPLTPEVIEGITERVLKERPPVAAAAPAAAVETAAAPVREAAMEKESAVKNVALFFAAPFFGLAYIIAFPFVAFAMLAKLLVQAMGTKMSERRS